MRFLLTISICCNWPFSFFFEVLRRKLKKENKRVHQSPLLVSYYSKSSLILKSEDLFFMSLKSVIYAETINANNSCIALEGFYLFSFNLGCFFGILIPIISKRNLFTFDFFRINKLFLAHFIFGCSVRFFYSFKITCFLFFINICSY